MQCDSIIASMSFMSAVQKTLQCGRYFVSSCCEFQTLSEFDALNMSVFSLIFSQ